MHAAYATGGKTSIVDRQQEREYFFNRVCGGDIPHELRGGPKLEAAERYGDTVRDDRLATHNSIGTKH